MTFNDAAVSAVFDKVVSFALASGRFDAVNQHEPKSSPGNGVTCAIWIQRIRPVRSSGLAFTSGVVELQMRIYTSFIGEPFDAIDPNVTAATSAMMAAFSGDFTLDGAAGTRAVDLLGMEGVSLSATAGYVEIDRQMFRVVTLTVPIVINDMWLQSGVVTDGPAGVSRLTVDYLTVNQDLAVGDAADVTGIFTAHSDANVLGNLAVTNGLTVAGVPVYPSGIGDYWAGQMLTAGESCIPRMGLGTAQAMASGVMLLSYWTAVRTETCSKITMVTGSVAAGATPTYAAMGIYSVNANGDITLMAQCANDTTLFNTTFTTFTRNLNQSISKVRGQRYAIAVLTVSAAAIPNFFGLNGTIPQPQIAPKLAGTTSSNASLPSSVLAANIGSTSTMYYGNVTP